VHDDREQRPLPARRPAGGEYKLRFEASPIGGNPDYLPQVYPGVRTLAQGTVIDLAAGATETGIDAVMQTGGRISGTVVGEAGEPIEGLSVCAYPVLGPNTVASCFETESQTATDGTYTLRGLYDGEYRVHFGSGSNYLPQWWDGQATRLGAPAVTVSGTADTSGIDAKLRPGGTISGTVTDAASHAPVHLYRVCAFSLVGDTSRCVQTATNGTYKIGGLSTGEYQVGFGSSEFPEAGYLGTFYGGSPDRAGAAHVGVTAGSEVGGIDAAIEKGGTISGHVTAAIGGEPVRAVQACAFSGGKSVGLCDLTDAEGNYTIAALPQGSYAVEFAPGGGFETAFITVDKNQMSQFYHGVASEAEATPVVSGPGTAVTGIDAETHDGGGIAGAIMGPLGEPLRGVTACIVSSGEALGGRCAQSDKTGRYEIEGLRPGSYFVRFLGAGAGNGRGELSGGYFDDVQNFSEAQAVEVIGTAVREGIDAHLIPGGTIEGTVVDAYDDTPIFGASVCAVPVAAPEGNCVETDGSGGYSMNVPSGAFQVEFSLSYWEEVEVEEFTTQYFDGAASPAAANTISVGSGATVAGIDASVTAAAARSDTVSVVRVGQGSGEVTSTPAGIDCGATCVDSFETRKTVTLHADPEPGSTFTGWTGACAGVTADSCQIRLTSGVSAAATFESIGESTTPPTAEQPSSPQPSTPAPIVQPKPKPRSVKPRPKRVCRKGYKLKKVGKKERCVKKVAKRPRKHHPASH
jgi:hypothetical protein